MEEWTDREGKARQTLEVNASDVQFLDSASDMEGIPVRQSGGGGAGGGQPSGGGGGGSRGGSSGGGGGRPAGDDIEDDEIPF
jgi:single-strand DNA-binding protein